MNPDSPESLFARFRRDADAGALAAVFEYSATTNDRRLAGPALATGSTLPFTR